VAKSGNAKANRGLPAKSNRTARVLVALAIIVTLLAAYYGGQYWLLVADGETTRALGIKVERQAQVGKNLVGDPYRYFANYAFADLAGQRRSGRQSIGRDQYEALVGGKFAPSIEVRYSRSLPGVNVIDMRALRTVVSVLVGLALLGWSALAVGYRRSRLARR
jgi:ABC-type Fe3+-siderophore transport system permease subunit